MLNRRYLRTKTLQSLYEYLINENQNINTIEKNLKSTIASFKILCAYQFGILPVLTKIAEEKIEDAKNKFLPTNDDLHPSMNFINNIVIKQITDNISLQQIFKESKINFGADLNIPKQIFQKMIEAQEYKNYLKILNPTFDQDRDFLIEFYENIFLDNDLVSSFFDEKNINWQNDFYDAGVQILKIIKKLEPQNDNLTRALNYDNEEEYIEEIEFITILYRETIKNNSELKNIITPKIDNWDTDRIALLDMIIMKMAITEFIYCKTIPIKVTINEYLEIAKEYSTPKSSQFINGILDNLATELKQNDRIQKIGRGLIN